MDILRFIEPAALTTDEIYASMLARYAVDEDPELLESIENVTALLEQLGVLTSIR